MMKTLDIEKLKKEDEVNKIIVTFDIESIVYTDEDGNDIHKPNLLVSGMLYSICVVSKLILLQKPYATNVGTSIIDAKLPSARPVVMEHPYTRVVKATNVIIAEISGLISQHPIVLYVAKECKSFGTVMS